MSQIEFTSACAGDIGVTLMDEVVTIAFIKKNPGGPISSTEGMIYQVDVHNIRLGGYPEIFHDLASALSRMLVLADNYRTADIEAEIERQCHNQQTEDARWDSYFASNKDDRTTAPLGSVRFVEEDTEEQELVAKFKEAGLWCLLEDKEE